MAYKKTKYGYYHSEYGYYRAKRLRGLRKVKYRGMPEEQSSRIVARDCYKGKTAGYKRFENDRVPPFEIIAQLSNYYGVKNNFCFLSDQEIHAMKEILVEKKRLHFDNLGDEVPLYKVMLLESAYLSRTDCTDKKFFLDTYNKVISDVALSVGLKSNKIILHKGEEYDGTLDKGERSLSKSKVALSNVLDFGILTFEDNPFFPDSTMVAHLNLDPFGFPLQLNLSGHPRDVTKFKTIFHELEESFEKESIRARHGSTFSIEDTELKFLRDSFLQHTNYLYHLWAIKSKNNRFQGESSKIQLDF